MNIYKKISAAATIVAVAMMTSCSDKGYWEEAPMEDAFSFQCANYSETLGPGANEIVIPINRTNTTGDQSVSITFTPGENCPSDISVPSQVTFADGSLTTNIVISIANATPPFTYAGTLEFGGTPSYAAIKSVAISCPVAYTWSSVGTGYFLDAWVMGDIDPYPVEILKADGFDRYRVMSPYAAYYASDAGRADWEDWIASTGPAYVEFWENAEGTLSFNSYATGLNYQAVSGQGIGAYSWDAFAEGSGYTGETDIWYAPGFAVLSPVYYIPGVGGFGQVTYSVQIELP